MAQSTEEVLNHHLQMFGAGDLAGTLEDYSSGSVIISPDGSVLRGLDQISGLFQAFFAEFAKPGASFSLNQQVVEGEIAYIAWSAETADNVYELGTDTFLIRDGKIVTQTVAVKANPKR